MFLWSNKLGNAISSFPFWKFMLRKVSEKSAESHLTLFRLVYFIIKPIFTGYQEVTSYKTTFPGEHI